MSPTALLILDALNRRLRGRGKPQATCLALSIDRNGLVTLVNAGHMSPYLNGEPVAMEGALLLGMVDHVRFCVMRFPFHLGDKLVLLSGGIAEATDADGRLLRFEWTHDLLLTAGSAPEIAAAAQAFGRENDIRVVIVTRTPGAEPSVVSDTANVAEPGLVLTNQAAQIAG